MSHDEAFMKVAHDTPAIIREAGSLMRKMAGANITLEKRASNAERELQAMKLARKLEDRGLNADLDFDQKVARIMGMDQDKIASFEAGIELAASGGGLGAVMSEEDAKTASSMSAGAPITDADFDSFILTGGAFSR